MSVIDFILRAGAQSAMTEVEFLEKEIEAWLTSATRLMQITADRYYRYEHDILTRTRKAIGQDGTLVEITNLPNNKLIDNQYAKAVDQKTNYLFAKPFTVDTEDKAYAAALAKVFDYRFRRKIKKLGRDAINGGIAWLHPYYDDNGKLTYKIFAAYEVLPFWKDAEHTELESAARVYDVEGYEGKIPVTITKVEYYSAKGIERYVYQSGHLIPDVEDQSTAHFTVTADGVETPMLWERIPLIPFKFDDCETPLLKRVKSLQDAINMVESDFMNVMQEDPRNTILILENYDGTDLGQFRRNLALFGVVKVASQDGSRGDVRTLTIEVNAENYKTVLELLKKALIENARALDAKDDRLGSSANEMNIQSMYSDMDLDANGMELEFQASFEDLLFFITADMANKKAGDFTNVPVSILFNRDLLISESQSITNLKNSVGIISDETIVANHPLVKDKDKELKRIKAEQKAATELMSEDPLKQTKNGDSNAEVDVNV